MRPGFASAVCFLLGVPAGGAEPPQSLKFEPYVVQGFDGVERKGELGRLKVPARRAQPAAGSIELAVVRLASTAATPGDPILFLMGGPGIGASVMGRVPPYAQLFERLRTVSDVILLDQRGTGLSSPSLDCPAREKPLGPGAFESRASLLAEMKTELEACVAAFRARGIDATAYTSRDSAADVSDLRRALGARRVQLLGYSYGTELALTVIREHRDDVARAVLAGVRGPDQSVKLPSVYELKLRQMAGLAAESPAFAKTLQGPNDLVARVESLLGSKSLPIRVSVTRQATQEPVELRVGREGLQMLLVQNIDSPRLPALVVSLERGDTRVLARVLEPFYNGLSRGGSSLMARAVNCAAGASPERRAQATAEAEWALLGLPFDDVMVSPDYCGLLGEIELPAPTRRRFASDVPALFVSGQLDSQTPPAQAEDVRYGFRQGTHLVIDGARHELLVFPAVQEAIVDFFRGQGVAARRLVVEPDAFLGVEDAASRPCGPRGC
jgi:pimeloyl-ACP methyl ester carboxylesterase